MADADDDEREEGDDGAEKGTRTGRVKPIYCTVCTLPLEYCEFQPTFDKCKEQVVANWATHFPDVTATDEITALMTKLRFEGEPDAAALKARTAKKPTAADDDKDAPAASDKKKAAKSQLQPVVITISQRNKRKFVTSVSGLEHHGVKLADAAKAFGKKFSCGSSVVKGKAGQGDCIDIQGDFKESLAELIAEQFSVDRAALFFSDGGKKVPMFD